MAAVGARFTSPQDARESSEKAAVVREIEKTMVIILRVPCDKVHSEGMFAMAKRRQYLKSCSYALSHSVCKLSTMSRCGRCDHLHCYKPYLEQ